MSLFIIKCGQRGCASQVIADEPPAMCPTCNQPLLEGNVTDVTPPPVADPPVADPPVEE